jgi:rhodanese-related sulfurtransferase
MIFKIKSIQLLLLEFVLSLFLLIGLISFGQTSVLAATGNASELRLQSGMPTMSQENLSVKSEVTHFLKAMPTGYYTIANAEKLKKQLDNPKTVLIDVREISEYQSGHIPGAVNIPLRSLPEHLEQIPSDQPVILYCSSGYRSALGVMTLHLLGYDNIQGFPPSFNGWKNAGEAIAKS